MNEEPTKTFKGLKIPRHGEHLGRVHDEATNCCNSLFHIAGGCGCDGIGCSECIMSIDNFDTYKEYVMIKNGDTNTDSDDKWIDFKLNLPKPNHKIFVYSKKFGVVLTHLYPSKTGFAFDNMQDIEIDFTHWMYINFPNKPKEI